MREYTFRTSIASRLLNEDYIAEIRRANEIEARRGKICNIVGWISGVFGVLLCLYFLSVVCAYIILNPKPPLITLGEFKIKEFSQVPVHNHPVEESDYGYDDYDVDIYTVKISLKFVYEVRYANRNSMMDIHNEYLKATALYRGFELGAGYYEHFITLPNESNTIYVTVDQQDLRLPKNVYVTIKPELELSTITFVVDFFMKAKMSIGGKFMSPMFSVRITCEIHLSAGIIDRQTCRYRNT